ncbi:ABC transporter permease [Actinomadura harenae]|uniref:ABC transporter permease n=1 Tax=Actinomadura harenae TaxID=2483351 RepID=A0A3M2LRC4_9ACTN|nr:ABC transporter permease [Actinomadura harenae]RMI39947.1 ABC transporter permease [Actinomadura harenae]
MTPTDPPAAHRPHATPPRATPLARGRAVLTSEWIKLRSLRSLWTTALTGFTASVGLSLLVCSSYRSRWHHLGAQARAHFHPTDTGLGFLQITALFFGALGALAVTTEYGTGQIHGTLMATPQRPLVLAAKTLLLFVLGSALALATVSAAFLLGQSRLTGTMPHASLTDPGAAHAVLGGALYLTLTGLLGLFLGTLVRSTAIALSTLLGLFTILPVLVDDLPKSPAWRHTVPYLPSNLGLSLWHSHIGFLVRPAPAAGTLALYVLVAAAAALTLLRTRDG